MVAFCTKHRTRHTLNEQMQKSTIGRLSITTYNDEQCKVSDRNSKCNILKSYKQLKKIQKDKQNVMPRCNNAYKNIVTFTVYI